MRSPSPETLAVFDREASALEGGELDLADPIPRGHSIVDAVISVLEAVLRLADVHLSFDPSLREEVAEMEEDAWGRGQETLAHVLRVYQDLAGLYPDVLGFTYGGTPDDFMELRRTIVPDLLEAACDWASQEGCSEFAKALEESRKRWKAALRGIDR